MLYRQLLYHQLYRDLNLILNYQRITIVNITKINTNIIYKFSNKIRIKKYLIDFIYLLRK